MTHVSAARYSPGALFALIVLLTVHAAGPAAAVSDQGDLAALRTFIERGDYEGAEDIARRHLEGLSTGSASDPAAAVRATDAYVDALILNGKGALDSTLTLATAAVREARQRFGAAHHAVAPSLVGLGRTLTSAGRFPDAIKVLAEAVARSENVPAQSDTLITALDALGRALDRAGRSSDDALAALKRSAALQQTANTSLRRRARTWQALASVLQARGDYPGARRAIDNALALHEQAGDGHPDVVETLVQLGSQWWFEGNLPESQRTLARAVAAAESTLRTDHPTIAAALRKLASTTLDLGDVAGARALQERAINIVERSLGPAHIEVAAYVNSLADTSMFEGDYPTARRDYKRALAIAKAHVREPHEWLATFTHNLAIVDSSLGDFAAARREHRHAITMWESVSGRSHPVVAAALAEMAQAWQREGSPAEAVKLLDQALTIRRVALGPKHTLVARTLADLALALDRVGQNARARQMAQQALAIFDAMQDPPAPDLAQVLTLSAELHARRGEFEAALRDYTRAREIRLTLFGAAHPLVAETDLGLALVYAALGQHATAFTTAADAETMAREHLRATLRYLPERESLNYQRNRTRGLDLMISLATATPELVAGTFDAVIRNRALVLDEMISRRRINGDTPAAPSAAEARLAAAQRRFATVVVRATTADNPARFRATLDQAQREAEEAEESLVAASAAFREAREREQAGLLEVAAALPSDATLVAFLRFDRVVAAGATGHGAPRQALRRTPSYAAFVLRAGSAPVAVPLGGAAEIDTLITEWRGLLGADALSPAASGAEPSRKVGARLRARLWDPLQAAIGQPQRILIVPDGALSLVPFAALPVGPRGFVIERTPRLHYLTAERDVTDPSTPAAGRGLLALGGASFGLSPSAARAGATRAANGSGAATRVSAGCAELGNLAFDPLAGSEQEVRQIERVWRDANGPTEAVRVLIGAQASETLFNQHAPGSRVLHLATHGFFLSSRCVDVLPGTRAVGGLVAARPSPKNRPAGEAMSISALALAGANRRARAAANQADGILLADEVAAMALDGVEWAVLSACDTGTGRLVAGEGVIGLRRAFRIAGVRTVIMTLWQIDDEATTGFMRELYRARFAKRLPTDQAMHAASLAVLQGRRRSGLSTSPFFWAAFLAAGDWR